MKVICIDSGVRNPYHNGDSKHVKVGKTYTVTGEQSGFATCQSRIVHAYSLAGFNGLFEKQMFIPIQDNETIKCSIKRVAEYATN